MGINSWPATGPPNSLCRALGQDILLFCCSKKTTPTPSHHTPAELEMLKAGDVPESHWCALRVIVLHTKAGQRSTYWAWYTGPREVSKTAHRSLRWKWWVEAAGGGQRGSDWAGAWRVVPGPQPGLHVPPRPCIPDVARLLTPPWPRQWWSISWTRVCSSLHGAKCLLPSVLESL